MTMNKNVQNAADANQELLNEVKRLNSRMDRLDRLLQRSELLDIMEIYTNPAKRIRSNLIAGISRGLGMTLGTALVITLAAWFLSRFLSVPIVGDYVKDIIDYVKLYG